MKKHSRIKDLFTLDKLFIYDTMEVQKGLTMTKDDRAYRIADRLYWIFIENTHPSYLNDYIEEDPDNPQGTRNTERGRELFEELEEFVRNTI